MKKLNLLSVLLCAGAITLAGCNNGGGGNTKQSGSSAPTSGQTTSGTSGASGSTSGTSGSESGSSSTSSTPVKTDWTDAEKALMRQALDGEVLPFFKGEWGWEVDQSGHLAGGALNIAASDLKQAFASWEILVETAAQLKFEKDSANGEAVVTFDFAGSSVSLDGQYQVGWPIATKQLMRRLLNGWVIPYAASMSSVVWTENDGALVGTVSAETFGYMALYNMSESLGLLLMDYSLSDPITFLYSSYLEDGQYDVASVTTDGVHTVTVSYTPAATAWSQAQLAYMATYLPEPFPFVGNANWDISWNTYNNAIQFRAPAVQLSVDEAVATAVQDGGYRLVTTSGGATYFEKVLSSDKTLIDCFATSNAVFTFILVTPANTPASGDWSTANKAAMASIFGEGVYLPFPGESWYEGEVSSDEFEVRGVELTDEKAAAIVEFFAAEGYDTGIDPENENATLMCKSNGAGQYFNVKLRKSTLRQTYYLSATLDDNPNIDRTTFEVNSSSNEVELGDTFTVSVTRGNFVEGSVEFSVNHPASVEEVSVSAEGNSVTYRVLEIDDNFEITASIPETAFTDTIAVNLVAVTWSAEVKALMRANYDGQTLPYAESIKDMEWALVEGHVTGTIPTETANLDAVVAVYEDAGSGYTLASESAGVYIYQMVAEALSVTTTYTVVISENEGVVSVVASFARDWSATAVSAMEYYLDTVLPFFDNTNMIYNSGKLYFMYNGGAEGKAAISNIFLADASWTDWGWDDDEHQTGSRWFYKYSNYGRIVVRIFDEGYVMAYVYAPYDDYSSEQEDIMTEHLDGVILPSIAGIQITVQYNTTYGCVIAVGFSNAENCYTYFLYSYAGSGYTMFNMSSYYVAIKGTEHGALYVMLQTYDGGGGYSGLQAVAYYTASITEWSEDDKTLMTTTFGEGVLVPNLTGAWEGWSPNQSDATKLECEGYAIDVDQLESELSSAGFLWDVDNEYYYKELDASHNLVIEVDAYGSGAIVDLTAYVVTVSE